MHTFHVWPIKIGPVTVVSHDGRKSSHDDLKSAVKAYNSTSLHLSRDRKEVLRGGGYFCEGTKIRFYDGWGLIYDPLMVLKMVEEVDRDWSRRWYGHRHVKPEHYRCQVVPHTGRRGRGCGYRTIRTHQELRAVDALEHDEEMAEYGIRVRGNRTRSTLPDDREDIQRNYGDRSWKKNRITQWKQVRAS